jgi:hypothetical protein
LIDNAGIHKGAPVDKKGPVSNSVCGASGRSMACIYTICRPIALSSIESRSSGSTPSIFRASTIPTQRILSGISVLHCVAVEPQIFLMARR